MGRRDILLTHLYCYIYSFACQLSGDTMGRTKFLVETYSSNGTLGDSNYPHWTGRLPSREGFLFLYLPDLSNENLYVIRHKGKLHRSLCQD